MHEYQKGCERIGTCYLKQYVSGQAATGGDPGKENPGGRANGPYVTRQIWNKVCENAIKRATDQNCGNCPERGTIESHIKTVTQGKETKGELT